MSTTDARADDTGTPVHDLPGRRRLLVEAGLVALGAAVLAVLAVPAFGEPGAPVGNVLLNWFGPEKHGVAELLRSGELPLWSRSAFGGEPLVANIQHGVLYPLNLPFWVLPTSAALEVVLVLHFALAAVGGWAFCRIAHRTSAAAGALAGLAFALGGFTLGHLVLLNQQQVVAWTPWVLLAAHLVLERAGRRWVVLFALAVGMQLLAGHPEEFLYTLVAVAAYGAAWLAGRAWAERRAGRAWAEGEAGRSDLLRATARDAARGAARLGAGVGLMLLLFAFQVLPTLQLVGLGYRNDPTFAGEVPLIPATALNALLPDYGRVVIGENPAHVGVVVLVLAAVGLVARGRGWVRGWAAAIAVGGFVLALGSETPAFRALQDAGVPFFSDLRVPVRWMLLPYLAFVVLGAFGLDAVLASAGRAWGAHARTAGLAVAALLAGAAGVLVLGDVSVGDAGGGWWLAAALVVAVVYLAARSPRVPRAALAGLLLVVLAVELVQARPGAEYQIRAPDTMYDDYGPLLDRLGEEGGRMVSMPDYAPTPEDVERLDIPEGVAGDGELARSYQHEISTRLQAKPAAPTAVGAEGILGRDGGIYPTQELLDWYVAVTGGTPQDLAGGRWTQPPSAWRADALDLLGVRWWLAPPLEPGEEAVLAEQGFEPVATDAWATLWERDDATVAHLLHEVEVVPDGDDRLALVGEGELDLTEAAIVDEEPPLELDQPTAPDEVEVVERGRDAMTVRTDSDAAGLLVLADPAYPGWEVTVDGEPADLVVADHAFQGVYLEAGEHTVELRYEPRAFRVGVAVSLVTALALVGWWAAPRVRRRWTARPARREVGSGTGPERAGEAAR